MFHNFLSCCCSIESVIAPTIAPVRIFLCDERMFGEIFGAILLFGGILTGKGGFMQVKCGHIYNNAGAGGYSVCLPTPKLNLL